MERDGQTKMNLHPRIHLKPMVAEVDSNNKTKLLQVKELELLVEPRLCQDPRLVTELKELQVQVTLQDSEEVHPNKSNNNSNKKPHRCHTLNNN